MRKFLKRMGVAVAIACSLAFMSALVSPSSAQAVPSSITLDYYYPVPGEMTLVYSNGTTCPSGSISGGSVGIVDATFRDSSGTTFSNLFIGYTSSSGTWNSGSFIVPGDATSGKGSLTFYCTLSPSGGSPTLTFDPITVKVGSQSTGIGVDRTNIWHHATFSSVTSCGANSGVDLTLHSESYSTSGFTTTYGMLATDHVTADGSGNWSWGYDLFPSNGFFSISATYTLRYSCNSSSGSYNFILKADQYVAMGDSYSAGVGSFNYDLNSGSCDRSTDGYPYYLVDNKSLDLPDFVACSGAVTDDLFNGSPVQFSQLTSDTQVVTLTIGGNDVDFAGTVNNCAEWAGKQGDGWGCSSDSALQTGIQGRMSALGNVASATTVNGRAVHSYASVLSTIYADAPNANVYIAGYPHLFGSSSSNYTVDGNAPGGYKCIVNSTAGVSISYWDALFMNNEADALNSTIQNAVNNAPVGMSIHYVDPTTTFGGHGLCDTGTSYINPVTLGVTGPQVESFHPTVTGMQAGYGVAFAAAM